jgi:hypothetical protein
MKTCFILALALTLTAVCTSSASEEGAATKSVKAKQQPTASKEKMMRLTGSYIKSDIRRSGFITDGAHPVAILDSKTIRNSGAADLSQLLIRTGYRR